MAPKTHAHPTARRRLARVLQEIRTTLEAEELNALAVREYNAANFIAVAVYSLKRARRSM